MTGARATGLSLAEAARAGTLIRCPACRHFATATPAYTGRNPGGFSSTSTYWARVNCIRCGSNLYSAVLLVDAADAEKAGGLP